MSNTSFMHLFVYMYICICVCVLFCLVFEVLLFVCFACFFKTFPTDSTYIIQSIVRNIWQHFFPTLKKFGAVTDVKIDH